jgi:hypothetical protein
VLRTRGIDDEAVAAVGTGSAPRHSPPLWWAAWLLSGAPGR